MIVNKIAKEQMIAQFKKMGWDNNHIMAFVYDSYEKGNISEDDLDEFADMLELVLKK